MRPLRVLYVIFFTALVALWFLDAFFIFSFYRLCAFFVLSLFLCSFVSSVRSLLSTSPPRLCTVHSLAFGGCRSLICARASEYDRAPRLCNADLGPSGDGGGPREIDAHACRVSSSCICMTVGAVAKRPVAKDQMWKNGQNFYRRRLGSLNESSMPPRGEDDTRTLTQDENSTTNA
jgi:hypothetical protein